MFKRYPKAIVRDLKVDKGELSEADALIAYLQRLGTQVDFLQALRRQSQYSLRAASMSTYEYWQSFAAKWGFAYFAAVRDRLRLRALAVQDPVRKCSAWCGGSREPWRFR